MSEQQENNNNQENKKTNRSYYHPQAYPATYPQYGNRQSGQMKQQGQTYPQQTKMYPQQSQMQPQQMQMYPQQSQMQPQQMQMYPQQSQMPPQQMQMYPQQSQMQQLQTDIPGMLPMQQSYIENILRLNQGEMATVYATFETNEQVSFKGMIEAAGRDHIILSDPNTGRRVLLLMVYVDYITFDGEINYSYPFGLQTQQTLPQ